MTSSEPIYLDHAASTPCDPRVVEAMLPYFSATYGNPSSAHAHGRAVRAAIEQARAEAAALVGAQPHEVVFTSGASESDNLAVKGVARGARAQGSPRGHLVTSAIEHAAVLAPCRRLREEGFALTVVAPDADGTVTPEGVAAALRDDTLLVSIMGVCNEIGTVADLSAIAAVCRERGALLHSDATQALVLLPLSVTSVDVDLLSWSGHKMHGPKGVGALYVRDRDPAIPIAPEIEGGSHERGLRAGTLNAASIVGFGAACAICARERDREATRLGALRARLEEGLSARIEGVAIVGAAAPRAPHITNFTVPALAGTRLVEAIEGVSCSSGSAITSGAARASHVLASMGVPDAVGVTSVRLSLGRTTTGADVDDALDRVAAAVAGLAVPGGCRGTVA